MKINERKWKLYGQGETLKNREKDKEDEKERKIEEEKKKEEKVRKFVLQ